MSWPASVVVHHKVSSSCVWRTGWRPRIAKFYNDINTRLVYNHAGCNTASYFWSEVIANKKPVPTLPFLFFPIFKVLSLFSSALFPFITPVVSLWYQFSYSRYDLVPTNQPTNHQTQRSVPPAFRAWRFRRSVGAHFGTYEIFIILQYYMKLRFHIMFFFLIKVISTEIYFESVAP